MDGFDHEGYSEPKFLGRQNRSFAAQRQEMEKPAIDGFVASQDYFNEIPLETIRSITLTLQ
jgi:hypothetical protein